MSDRKVKGYHRIATGGIHEGDCRGVGARGVGDAVNPGEGVAGVNGDVLAVGESMVTATVVMESQPVRTEGTLFVRTVSAVMTATNPRLS